MQTRNIIMTSLTVALAMVYVSIFRGPANLLNAFLVPITLFAARMHMKTGEGVLMYSVLMSFCLLFYPIQLFFMGLYCLMAELLCRFYRQKALAVGLLSLVSGLGFFVAVRLTDLVFLTPMHTLFLGVFGGNWVPYIALFVAEGLFAGSTLVFSARFLHNRLGHFSNK